MQVRVHLAAIGHVLRDLSKLVWVLVGSLAILFILAMVLTSNPATEVTFQSSDGKWFERENHLKGGTYSGIVVAFEQYRAHCASGTVRLERTTPMAPWYSPRHYFDDYAAPKWRIPLVLPRATITPTRLRFDYATCTSS